ncbi:MAG: glycosyltransferase family 2 protein, partial [Phycisphaerae bacterium]
MNSKTIHRVSIIIPTHDRAALLRQTLESLTQLVIPADKNVELLIIANACADQTRHICEAATPNMPMPLRCVVEPMPGASQARNRGLTEANGDILAFLDDDVAVDPHWLAGLLAVFEQYPADVVAG